MALVNNCVTMLVKFSANVIILHMNFLTTVFKNPHYSLDYMSLDVTV